MKKKIDNKNTFIGRDSELALFRTMYAKFLKDEDSQSKVILLMYSGDGGIGKTSLISRIEEELDNQNDSGKNSDYVHIDCNKLEDDITAMVNLISKLNEECRIRLPKFLKKLNDYLIACGRIESSELSETISGLASKLADEFVGSRAGMAVEVISWVVKKIKQNAIKSEYGDDTEKIAKELPKILAEELSEKLLKSNRHLVIFLDTFEVLKNNGYDTDWLDGIDGILNKLKNTMWVLSGREQPVRVEYNNLTLKELQPFEKEEGIDFLINQGVSADYAEELWALSHGIPNHLKVLSDTYKMQMKLRGDIDKDELKGSVNDILERRYTLYLSDEQKNVVKILACLGSWTDELLIRMFFDENNVIEFDINMYEEIKEFTFISKDEEDKGLYTLSKSMRDILIPKINGEFRKRLHKIAYQTARELLADIGYTDEKYGFVQRIALEQFKLSFGDDTEAMEKELYNLSDLTMAVNQSIISYEDRIRELEQDCSGKMQEYFDVLVEKLVNESLFLYDDDINNLINKYWCIAEQQTELPQNSLAVLSFKADLLQKGYNLTYSFREKYDELYEQLKEIQQEYADSKEYNILRANVMINRIHSIQFVHLDKKDKIDKNEYNETDAAIKEFISWWVKDCPFYPDDENYSQIDEKAAELLVSYIDCSLNKIEEIAEKKAFVDMLSEITQTDRCPRTLNAAREKRPDVYSSYSSKIRDVADAKQAYDISVENYGEDSPKANYTLYILLLRLEAEDSPDYKELLELASKYVLTEIQNANKCEEPTDQYRLLKAAEIIFNCCEELGDFTPAQIPLYRIYIFIKYHAKADDDADSQRYYYKRINNIAQLLSKVYNKLLHKEMSVDVLVDMYDFASVKCGGIFSESEMYFDLADACYKAGLYDRGESYIGKIGFWDKKSLSAFNLKAKLYAKNGKAEQAVKIAEENLTNAQNGMYEELKKPTEAVLTLTLALCHCMAGNKQRSQELVSSQIIESNKNDELVKNNLHIVEELLAQQ